MSISRSTRAALTVIPLVLLVFLATALSSKVGTSERSFTPGGDVGPDLARQRSAVKELSRLLTDEPYQIDEQLIRDGKSFGSRTYRISFSKPQTEEAESIDEQWRITAGDGRKNAAANVSLKRALELSETQILAIAIDERQQVRWWDTLPDPRFFVAHDYGQDGELKRGKKVFRPLSSMLLSIPADPEITSVAFYSPIWDGSQYRLTKLGGLNLE